MSKTYTFTDVEIVAIREALDHYRQYLQKQPKSNSSISIQMKRTVELLLYQFRQDVFDLIPK